MTTFIISGSRKYKSKDLVWYTLTEAYISYEPVLFKFGDCPTGADAFTKEWCDKMGNPYEEFKADWDKSGKSAGPIRNHLMIDSGGEMLLAFPDNDSVGTKDAAIYARSKGMPVIFPELVTLKAFFPDYVFPEWWYKWGMFVAMPNLMKT